MALEIIVRRRRNAERPVDTDSREKPIAPERAAKEDPPANDNEGTWPFVPFPEGW